MNDPARPVHDWTVPEREYRRHEQRRGRRHAFTELVPARTALVVVDLVPFFVGEPWFPLGVVDRVNTLAGVVRRTGGRVVWVLPGAEPPLPARLEFYGATIAETYRLSGGGEGEPTGRLWHELTVDPGDDCVEKTASSAFFPGRSPLPALLTEAGVDTVLLAGTTTDVCCESSVRDAATLGFRTILVADGCASATDDAHNATLRTVYRSFGDVRPVAELVTLLEAQAGSA